MEAIQDIEESKPEVEVENIEIGEDLHPEIEEEIGALSIPHKARDQKVNTVIKASFGFGDVNACVIFRKLKN